MSKVLQINKEKFGSTGTIMYNIALKGREHGHQMYTSSAKYNSQMKPVYEQHLYIGGILGRRIHAILSELTGKEEGFSRIATWLFLRKVDKIKPDIIHMHNLHMGYINLEMLFHYFEKHKEIKLVWTLHDCWAYTGRCPHYVMAHCERWKTLCKDCPTLGSYPKSRVDNSTKMFQKKKKLFLADIPLTLVTPSRWLYEEVKKSYLKDRECIVINNGINLDIFQPRKSDFKAQHQIEDKFMILGVAFDWSERKGLDVFVKLAETLDSSMVIVLIGLDAEQIESLKDYQNIIAMGRTDGPVKLAEIYTASDVFLNPTREDTYPTTNLEAIACGTPVITFRTGGSPEAVEPDCGFVLEKDDINGIREKIQLLKENPLMFQEKLTEKSKKFDRNIKFEEYIRLYDCLLDKEKCQ